VNESDMQQIRENRLINMQIRLQMSYNNDLQNITQKTRDRATRTPLKIGVELLIFLKPYW
jgi:hypothetical protein